MNRSLLYMSISRQVGADKQDYRGLSYDPSACCFAANLIFILSLSRSPWRRGELEVSRARVQWLYSGWSLLQSEPQTTGKRHAEAGDSSQNLRWLSLYAALQCSSVNRPGAAIGDSRVKTPMRVGECGSRVPGRSVSAAILQLGIGWRIGTFVGHRDVTKHSWSPLARCSLSPLSRVAVLVHSQLATLCKLRQSYQCAGNARAHQTSVPDLSKSAVFFSETLRAHLRFINRTLTSRGSEQNEFHWQELSFNFEEKKIRK